IMSFYKGSKTRIKNSNAQDMNLEAYFSSKGRHFCSGYVSKFKEFHKLSIVGEIIYKSQEDPGKFSLFPIYLWITERKAYSVAKKILEKK
ncbi:MAG TPA: hypothetical protein VEC16_03440, partial [Alphaproteobacteria bacterium]|nr:hypothetical protein [Alphaproteobacteria bacterium]